MIIKRNVQSSDIVFKQLDVNVDTVFYRFNQKKIIEKDEETNKDTHVGWMYDEIWYNKDEYIEKISHDNDTLAKALIEMGILTTQKYEQNEKAIVELAMLMGGVV